MNSETQRMINFIRGSADIREMIDSGAYFHDARDLNKWISDQIRGRFDSKRSAKMGRKFDDLLWGLIMDFAAAIDWNEVWAAMRESCKC